MSSGQKFDTIIVGARCAGTALAQHLASAGRSVALLDAARLPSDQSTSTHLIHPPGLDELERVGIADAVRQSSPALLATRLSFDGCEARLPFREGRAAHCLRRETLDALLQRAAVAAGAELRDRSRVVDLIRDEQGAARGVVIQRAGERTERLRANLVVGADGRNSTIARLVRAEEYLGYAGPRSVYWAYWPRPSAWDPHELHNTFEGRSVRVIFPTDRDQLLIATAPPVEVAEQWRSKHADAYFADIAAYQPISSYLGATQPIGRVRGVFKLRYFFRTAVGPGWALIGDARHHKEFVVGLGISDALRDARGLAEAVAENDSQAPEQWWRQRDAEQIEMFYWGRDVGDGRQVNALQRMSTLRLAQSPSLQPRIGEVIDGRLQPYDFIPTGVALRWTLSALLRGDVACLSPFVQIARRQVAARHQQRLRRRLAQRCSGDDSRLPPLRLATQ